MKKNFIEADSYFSKYDNASTNKTHFDTVQIMSVLNVQCSLIDYKNLCFVQYCSHARAVKRRFRVTVAVKAHLSYRRNRRNFISTLIVLDVKIRVAFYLFGRLQVYSSSAATLWAFGQRRQCTKERHLQRKIIFNLIFSQFIVAFMTDCKCRLHTNEPINNCCTGDVCVIDLYSRKLTRFDMNVNAVNHSASCN